MLWERTGTALERRPVLTKRCWSIDMAKRADITPELCRQLLRYDPETGKLYWLPRPASMYGDSVCHGGVRTAQWAADAWNGRHAGKEAFTATNDAGYHVGTILGMIMRAHRVIWAIEHGEWPPNQIDHGDGDRGNNRSRNLGLATNAENHKNEGKPKNNTSGVAGVRWCKQAQRWRATIKVDYRERHLGRFNTIEEATAAREAAKARFGFAANHGRRDAWTA
jgi:hypothetical protein